VYAVVNQLRLREGTADGVAEAFREEGFPRLRHAAGLQAAHLVEASPDHLILVLLFDSREAADLVTQSLGDEWMREHVVPHLVDSTDRSAGEVVASTET
jgi:hypothetical protein